MMLKETVFVVAARNSIYFAKRRLELNVFERKRLHTLLINLCESLCELDFVMKSTHLIID